MRASSPPVLVIAGPHHTAAAWLLATEVLATILGLFVFGSFRYQIHKNALTYGMLLVIVATFCRAADVDVARRDRRARLGVLDRRSICCPFAGLDDLIHADTMLFILGLTLFVSVIAQTRVLEGITFFLLRRYDGRHPADGDRGDGGRRRSPRACSAACR